MGFYWPPGGRATEGLVCKGPAIGAGSVPSLPTSVDRIEPGHGPGRPRHDTRSRAGSGCHQCRLRTAPVATGLTGRRSRNGQCSCPTDAGGTRCPQDRADFCMSSATKLRPVSAAYIALTSQMTRGRRAPPRGRLRVRRLLAFRRVPSAFSYGARLARLSSGVWRPRCRSAHPLPGVTDAAPMAAATDRRDWRAVV